MTAVKRDTSRKRTAILDAAVSVFQESGYENASMDHIAEVAQASKRTVYNHFPSKEELFQAVFDRLVQETLKLKRIEYSSGRSLEEQLGEFAEAKIAVSRNPAWLGLMKISMAVFISRPELAEETARKTEGFENALAKWLKAATEDGRLDVRDPDLASEVFWAMVGGAFFWPAIIHGPMAEERADGLKGELIGTFLARYRQR